MDTKLIDSKTKELKEIEEKIAQLSTVRDSIRQELFENIQKNNVEQYKNDHATISYIERKTVKIADEEKLFTKLTEQKIIKYYSVIPEHKELTKGFYEDVKKGYFKDDLVEVESNRNLAIRFKKA